MLSGSDRTAASTLHFLAAAIVYNLSLLLFLEKLGAANLWFLHLLPLYLCPSEVGKTYLSWLKSERSSFSVANQ